MRVLISLLFLASSFTTNLWAQTPPAAEQVLSGAKTKAAAEHKSIFVVFDASW